uniref:WGS project CAEQ00000000 data, annotated contig 1806 n=1 Tax=Trypanosoma congolense (strain IL3000) TaxID=1068625 RepID=F9W903_TRYCI|nr:unnamed protein product [Trypanosoma congolense IL3000]
MRSDRYDVEPAVQAGPNDLVKCKLHGTVRMAKYCHSSAVCNADQVVIDFTYECKERSRCAGTTPSVGELLNRKPIKRNAEGREEPVSECKMEVMVSEGMSSAGLSTIAEGGKQPEGTQRGPSRYYDLAAQRAQGAGPMKKVCWNCGIEGHEKPNCPNMLCRYCHGVRSQNHFCQESRPSPFIVMCPTLQFSEEMSAVQCVSCSALGHFDCTTAMSGVIPSCCFCGGKGHSAFDCIHRKESAVDHWVARMRVSEGGPVSKNYEWGSNNAGYHASTPHFRAEQNRSYSGGGIGGSYGRDDTRSTNVASSYQSRNRNFDESSRGQRSAPHQTYDDGFRDREKRSLRGYGEKVYYRNDDGMQRSGNWQDQQHQRQQYRYDGGNGNASRQMSQKGHVSDRSRVQRTSFSRYRQVQRGEPTNSRLRNISENDEYYDSFF